MAEQLTTTDPREIYENLNARQLQDLRWAFDGELKNDAFDALPRELLAPHKGWPHQFRELSDLGREVIAYMDRADKRQIFRETLERFARVTAHLQEAWNALPADDADTDGYPEGWASFDEVVEQVVKWSESEGT